MGQQPLVVYNSKNTMVKLKDEVKGLFDITDLGKLNKLIGLEIMHNQEWRVLTIWQTQYIKNLPKKYLMHDGSAISTLLDPNVKPLDFGAQLLQEVISENSKYLLEFCQQKN